MIQNSGKKMYTVVEKFIKKNMVIIQTNHHTLQPDEVTFNIKKIKTTMNEIVTYGQNYKLTSGIKVIVQSAKKINCTLTVIGVNLESETKKYLKDNNVNIVDGCEIAEKHNVNLNLSPYTLKVIFFNLYAKKYTKSKNLYMCDFTDLFFQKDVFELIKSDKTM